MRLIGRYLSIDGQALMTDDKSTDDHPRYLDVENMYLEIAKNASKHASGFQLSTEGCLLQVECRDRQSAEAWIDRLAVYCVRFDIKDNYKILESLDKGGFAIVYLAQHLPTGKKVALKMVDRSKIKTARNYVGVTMTQTYMINEITIMRDLKHPNVVELIEVYEVGNHIALVLEYMNRGSVAQLIAKGPVDEKTAYSVLRSVLEALAYMHTNNIIHRDIKPGNIMLRDPTPGEGYDQICKIIDFGLCADLLDKSEDALIHDKSGTVGYLAPEIITKENKQTFYDARVDTFSTGIVFYEM